MDDLEYNAQLDELDHLLNDDDADLPAGSARIWDLLAAVSRHDIGQARHD